MTLDVTVVIGNPKAQSRTLKVATTVVERLLQPASYDLTVIELAEHADEVFSGSSPTMDSLTKKVAESDLVVFASPTYKATYTGLLKAFLDRYPANGLSGVVAIPVHTGGDATHSMGVTFTLAPLLLELGAALPSRGLYFIAGEIERVEEIVDEAMADYRLNLSRLRVVADNVPDSV